MITIKDMAEKAGVSPTTVSNVLHGRTEKMSPDTLKKVQQVIEESNYVSNMGARLLANYGSRLIGVIVTYDRTRDQSAIQDPFYSEIIGALEQEIRTNHYFMLLYTSANVDESLRMASAWNVEGLVVLGCPPQDCPKFKERTTTPIVFIDSYFQDTEHDYYNVGLDDFGGGYEMTTYLIRNGHKRIAFLADNENPIGVDFERLQGYKQALKDADIPFREEDFVPLHFKKVIRHTQLTEFAQERIKDYTALFFASDFYASDAINTFFSVGLRVPEDISVVGFDDNIFAWHCRPALTTVQQKVADKAFHAVKLLLQIIQGDGEIEEEKNIHLPIKLVVRQSVQVHCSEN